MVTRIMLPLLYLTTLTPGAATGQKQADDLQGDWVQVSTESRGQKLPDEVARKNKLTVKGDQWVADYGGKEFRSSFRTDSTTEPKTIDLMRPDSAPARGIYKLDGDTLTVCYATGTGAVRPTEFKTGKDFMGALTVWKRAGK